jgi:hypothetical protein
VAALENLRVRWRLRSPSENQDARDEQSSRAFVCPGSPHICAAQAPLGLLRRFPLANLAVALQRLRAPRSVGVREKGEERC